MATILSTVFSKTATEWDIVCCDDSIGARWPQALEIVLEAAIT